MTATRSMKNGTPRAPGRPSVVMTGVSPAHQERHAAADGLQRAGLDPAAARPRLHHGLPKGVRFAVPQAILLAV